MRSKISWKVYKILKSAGSLRFMELGTRSGHLWTYSYTDNNHPNFNFILLKLQTAQLITKNTPTTYSIKKDVRDPKEFDTLLREASSRLKTFYKQDLPPVSTLKLNYVVYCKRCKRLLTPSTTIYRLFDFKYCRDCWEKAIKRELKMALSDDVKEALEKAPVNADLNLLPSREL